MVLLGILVLLDILDILDVLDLLESLEFLAFLEFLEPLAHLEPLNANLIINPRFSTFAYSASSMACTKNRSIVIWYVFSISPQNTQSSMRNHHDVHWQTERRQIARNGFILNP